MREPDEVKQRSGGLGGWLRRMMSSNDELHAEELRRQSEKSGCAPVASCHDRQRAVIRGTISSLTINPDGECRRLEAEVRDGSGSVTLIWMGRRSIPGVEAGADIKVEGRLSLCDGRRVMYNPRYELVKVPGVS